MSITLQQIRYFLGVAGEKQISAAARNMNVSQSAVTLAIKDLEMHLGVSLFIRHSSGLTLTEAGETFLRNALSIDREVKNAIESVKLENKAMSGIIRLGVTHTLSGYFVFPFLSDFKKLFPDINIQLEELKREDLELKLISDEVDLALMVTSNGEKNLRLTSKVFHQSQRHLWVSSHHELLDKKKVYLKDLKNYPFVSLNADECGTSAKTYWQTREEKPNEVFASTSIEAVRNMVAIGEAVTILSDVLFRAWTIDGKRLQKITLADKIHPLEVGVVWRKGRKLNQLEKLFCSKLYEQKS
ncbi:MAG: LysR family transcriptional regulator [Methyloligella sp.]|nr:MAG: LysR family transcriptional regulator [Methyloligella sp.]